jgi:tetratricopeptide (TPR) repeat protein
VFRGGFTLEAAEAVVDLGAFDTRPAVIDTLHSLREKSLLKTTTRAQGEVCFGFFEAIREFAAKQLAASGERQAAQARHARFFLAPAEAWAKAADASLPYVDLDVTPVDDFDNLLAVHERAVTRIEQDPSAAREALCACIALEPILVRRESASERLARLERTLDAAQSIPEERAYRWLAFTCTRLKHILGSLPETRGDFDTDLARARSAGDASFEAWILNCLAARAAVSNELHTARAYYDEALTVCRRGGRQKIEAVILSNAAELELRDGQQARAQELFSAALLRARKLSGAHRSISVGYCLLGLGQIQQQLGNLDAARAHFERALDELERDPHSHGRLYGQASLARVLQEQGKLAPARTLYGEAIRGLREVEDPYASQLFASLGALLADSDDLVEAGQAFDQADDLVRAFPQEPTLSTIALHRGHLELARARALDAAGNREGAVRQRADARARLDAPAASDAFEVRFARRLLERALDKTESVSSASTPGRTLVVSRESHICRLPDGRVLDLGRRSQLWRVLIGLIEARMQTPGRSLSAQQLFESAWGGERVRYESARNRLYFAINALRDLGLRDLLLHDSEGYKLDPAVEVLQRPKDA